MSYYGFKATGKKHFSFSFIELSADHADLGAILNALSLSENGHLATSIEKTGQAIDATYMSTVRLVCLPISLFDTVFNFDLGTRL